MSPEEKRSNIIIVIIGMLLMAAAIVAIADCSNSTVPMGQDIGGKVLARYVGSGPTFYIAIDVQGERVEVSVSEEEFEFYRVGDYFVTKK